MKLDLFPWTLNYYSEDAGKHLAIACDGDLNQRLLENFTFNQFKTKLRDIIRGLIAENGSLAEPTNADADIAA